MTTIPPLSLPCIHDDGKDIFCLHQKIIAWYKHYGRFSLPWRNTSDPYAIYMSEVMLQQTQVKTVLERYYFPFITRFPDLTTLAEAAFEEVLKYWEGMGYYRRAHYIHQAAKQAAPALPLSVEALMALPGIGRNTAHAILAFAHHQALPVLEANVKRVISRVFALANPTEKILWSYAYRLMDTKNPFMYNQAMMDIGAMVCTRLNPKCDICPLMEICQGRGEPSRYPGAKKKKAIRKRHLFILVITNAKGQYYLTQRKTAFLHGLYGFVTVEKHKLLPEGKEWIGNVTQVYSHFILEGEVYHYQGIPSKLSVKGGKWYDEGILGTLPLSGVDHKVLGCFARKKIPYIPFDF